MKKVLDIDSHDNPTVPNVAAENAQTSWSVSVMTLCNRLVIRMKVVGSAVASLESSLSSGMGGSPAAPRLSSNPVASQTSETMPPYMDYARPYWQRD